MIYFNATCTALEHSKPCASGFFTIFYRILSHRIVVQLPYKERNGVVIIQEMMKEQPDFQQMGYSLITCALGLMLASFSLLLYIFVDFYYFYAPERTSVSGYGYT